MVSMVVTWWIVAFLCALLANMEATCPNCRCRVSRESICVKCIWWINNTKEKKKKQKMKFNWNRFI